MQPEKFNTTREIETIRAFPMRGPTREGERQAAEASDIVFNPELDTLVPEWGQAPVWHL